MEAKVKKAFPGCPDGQSITRMIEVGEIITGDLARVAVDEKWAKEINTAAEAKAKADAEAKAKADADAKAGSGNQGSN